MKITFKLNGEKRTLSVESHEVLLDTLRTRLAMKSPKCGCDRGDCGACSVLLNGKSVRSCLIFTAEIDGQDVTTVEGLSKNKLSKLQEAFMTHKAFQCGFCTPGMLIAATDLLSKNKTPTRDEVKEALGGQLCRCTGYKPIVDAVCSCGEKKAPAKTAAKKK